MYFVGWLLGCLTVLAIRYIMELHGDGDKKQRLSEWLAQHPWSPPPPPPNDTVRKGAA